MGNTFLVIHKDSTRQYLSIKTDSFWSACKEIYNYFIKYKDKVEYIRHSSLHDSNFDTLDLDIFETQTIYKVYYIHSDRQLDDVVIRAFSNGLEAFKYFIKLGQNRDYLQRIQIYQCSKDGHANLYICGAIVSWQ